jgi:hypothetical protein
VEKTIKRLRFSTDHVLFLKKTVAELPAKTCNLTGNAEAKAIKDIRSSTNVSDGVARSVYEARTSMSRYMGCRSNQKSIAKNEEVFFAVEGMQRRQ